MVFGGLGGRRLVCWVLGMKVVPLGCSDSAEEEDEMQKGQNWGRCCIYGRKVVVDFGKSICQVPHMLT